MTLQERNQAGASFASQAQHNELLAKINQLNVLRESNETLRAESEKHQRRSRSLATQVQTLEDQIGPLNEQVAILQAEVQARDAQIKLLEQDNARWKARNEQVLAKYERIDPADLQNLKQEVTELQTTLEEQKVATQSAETQKAALQEQLNSLNLVVTECEELRTQVTQLQADAEARVLEVGSALYVVILSLMNHGRSARLLNEQMKQRNGRKLQRTI